jgi:hypothetical protein
MKPLSRSEAIPSCCQEIHLLLILSSLATKIALVEDCDNRPDLDVLHMRACSWWTCIGKRAWCFFMFFEKKVIHLISLFLTFPLQEQDLVKNACTGVQKTLLVANTQAALRRRICTGSTAKGPDKKHMVENYREKGNPLQMRHSFGCPPSITVLLALDRVVARRTRPQPLGTQPYPFGGGTPQHMALEACFEGIIDGG